MKKLVTAFAACIIAGMVSAAVESINVVGYYTPTAFDVSGNYWIGQNLYKVGGADKGLATLFDDSVLQYGDTVQLFNGTEFVGYLWNGVGWEDVDLNVVGVDIPDIMLPAGSGFFLTSLEPITFTGEVGKTTVTTNLAPGYNLISAAFPVQFDVDNYDWSNLAYGDTIQMFNPGTYQFDGILWNGAAWEDVDLNEVHGVIADVGESIFVVVAGATSFDQLSPL